jgi:hypothetical protein
LVDEFFTSTGKLIEIQENSYYKTLIKLEKQPVNEVMSVPFPDVSLLRNQIEEVFESIRIIELTHTGEIPDGKIPMDYLICWMLLTSNMS